MSMLAKARAEISRRYRHHGRFSASLDRLNRLPLFQTFIDQSAKVAAFGTRQEMWDYLAAKERGAIDYLEFGVHEGLSLLHWASRNQDPASRFFGFDTFTGLPEHWNQVYPKGHFDKGGHAPATKDPRITFIKGLFQDTIDPFLATYEPQGARRVVHIDCDLYSSTLYCLTKLDAFLVPGTIVIFDEFGDVQHEFRAFNDYLSSYRRTARLICSHDNHYTAAVEMT